MVFARKIILPLLKGREIPGDSNVSENSKASLARVKNFSRKGWKLFERVSFRLLEEILRTDPLWSVHLSSRRSTNIAYAIRYENIQFRENFLIFFYYLQLGRNLKFFSFFFLNLSMYSIFFALKRSSSFLFLACRFRPCLPHDKLCPTQFRNVSHYASYRVSSIHLFFFSFFFGTIFIVIGV